MNDEIRNKIKLLSDSESSFERGWASEIWENVRDLVLENGQKWDETIDNLPEKLRTVFLLENLRSTIYRNGFFSVFYNETPYEIKRLRRAINLSCSKVVRDLFDEAFRLVEGEFTWADEHTNFVAQTCVSVVPHAEFSDELTDRIQEIEDQIVENLLTSECEFTDEFEKHLESYLKS